MCRPEHSIGHFKGSRSHLRDAGGEGFFSSPEALTMQRLADAALVCTFVLKELLQADQKA
jgi:hypothetical protein